MWAGSICRRNQRVLNRTRRAHGCDHYLSGFFQLLNILSKIVIMFERPYLQVLKYRISEPGNSGGAIIERIAAGDIGPEAGHRRLENTGMCGTPKSVRSSKLPDRRT